MRLTTHSPLSRNHRLAARQAFTLIELTVSIGLLVLIILAIGIVFQSTSRAIGLSQSTTEMLSNVRTMQQQLEHDISSMDHT